MLTSKYGITMAKQIRPLVSSDVESEVQQLKILNELVKGGPMGLGTLEQATGNSAETIRKTVRDLEKSGLVTPTAKGAEMTDAARKLLDEEEKDLEERIEMLENDELSFEPGAQPKHDEIEENRPQSSSGDSLFDRIQDLF